MQFASDNWAGCLPEIAEAVSEAARGHVHAYGDDSLTHRINAQFAEIFEHEVAVFFVSTGTAANALALSAMMQPGGIILSHANAHIIGSECGAIEFFTRARIHPIPSDQDRQDDGKLSAEGLRQALGQMPEDVFFGRPVAVSLTQASEQGTIYRAEELSAIGKIAKDHGLKLHMDGARFANALVATDSTAAELTWKVDVDCLSFGATKNGAMIAEAIVVFDPTLAANLRYLHKSTGQLISKSRFIAAQFAAYFKDDLWLRTASHANAMAQRLAIGLATHPDVQFGWPVEANEVFISLPDQAIQILREAGAVFYDWPGTAFPLNRMPPPGHSAIRLVTSFATTLDEVKRFTQLLGGPACD